MNTRIKIILTGLVALVVVLAVVLVWTITRPAPAAMTPPANTPVGSAAGPVDPTFNPSAGDAHDDQAHDPDLEAEAAWRPVVENFGRNFTNTTDGQKAWQTRLTGPRTPPYVTDAVSTQLQGVDVRNVPTGHYDSYAVVKASAYEVAVKVDYTEGWSMVLYLITEGTHWQIYAYDQWED